MNCPNCKNPIADDSQECEWCGCKIITKPSEKIEEVNEEEFDENVEVEENIEVEKNNSGCIFVGIFLLVIFTIILLNILNHFNVISI